jgi:hypothetical protein
MSSYPKWLYHSEHPAKVVHSAEEHAEHDGWQEEPVSEVSAEAEPTVDEVKPKGGRKKKSAEAEPAGTNDGE